MPRLTAEARRAYYHENKERLRAWYRARYARQTAKIKARVAKWQKENRPKIQAARREHDRKLRVAVFAMLGWECRECGYSDERALQLDHVSGGGNRELRALGHSRAVYRKALLANGAGYQLLCANCNTIKAREAHGETYKRTA